MGVERFTGGFGLREGRGGEGELSETVRDRGEQGRRGGVDERRRVVQVVVEEFSALD